MTDDEESHDSVCNQTNLNMSVVGTFEVDPDVRRKQEVKSSEFSITTA